MAAAGAPVDGYVGFAIGRSIWWDALKGFLEQGIEREAAAEQIAEKYLRFVQRLRGGRAGRRGRLTGLERAARDPRARIVSGSPSRSS